MLLKSTSSTFFSNKKLLLTHFFVPFQSGMKINYRIQTAHGEYIHGGDSFNQCIVLSEPYTIEADKSYTIIAHIDKIYGPESPKFYPLLSDSRCVEPDIVITFVANKADFMARLIFQIPKNNELNKSAPEKPKKCPKKRRSRSRKGPKLS